MKENILLYYFKLRGFIHHLFNSSFDKIFLDPSKPIHHHHAMIFGMPYRFMYDVMTIYVLLLMFVLMLLFIKLIASKLKNLQEKSLSTIDELTELIEYYSQAEQGICTNELSAIEDNKKSSFLSQNHIDTIPDVC